MPYKWFLRQIVNLFVVFIGFIAYLHFTSGPVFAVRINEVYTSPVSPNTEWVELFNETSVPADLSTFSLSDLAGNEIKLPDQILNPDEYIIASSSSVLNNSGETLFLKESGHIIHSISIPTLNSIQSYAACPNAGDNLVTTTTITKNISNLAACVSPTPTITTSPSSTPTIISPTNSPTPTLTTFQIQNTPEPSLSPSLTPSPSPTPTLTAAPLILTNFDSNQIYISEFSAYSTDTIKEWVEIYNDNDTNANLLGWEIDDIAEGASSIELDLIIGAKSIVVIELKSSIFNNGGDTIRLLDEDGITRDEYTYKSAAQATTFGRESLAKSSNFCQMSPSKAISNHPCTSNTIPSQSNNVNPSSTPTPTIISETPSYRVLSANTETVKKFQPPTISLLQTPSIEVDLNEEKTTSKQPKKALFFLISSFFSAFASTIHIVKKYIPINAKFW